LKSLLAFPEPGHILYGSDFPYAPASVSNSFAHQLDNYESYAGNQLREINYLNGLKLFPRLMK
jgi:aminocarboxymuconate-semialdehyde decarboxylase